MWIYAALAITEGNTKKRKGAKMVASTDHKERALALCESVKDLIEKDARDCERVVCALQPIKDGDRRFLVGSARTRARAATFSDCSPNEQWERVYRTICGKKKMDCAGIVMPPMPNFSAWPIIVVPEVPLNTMFACLKRYFNCWSYYGDDLENAIDSQKEERDGRTEPYGIWVRAVRDAREEMNNYSADAIKGLGIKTITLNERVRLEGFHWILTGGKKKGTHLDVNGWNICTGSRCSDGSVPAVHWGDDEVSVYWCDYGPADPSIGTRLAVTF